MATTYPYVLALSEKELDVLKLVLRVDLDALGVERKDQTALRAILKRLNKVKDGL